MMWLSAGQYKTLLTKTADWTFEQMLEVSRYIGSHVGEWGGVLKELENIAQGTV